LTTLRGESKKEQEMTLKTLANATTSVENNKKNLVGSQLGIGGVPFKSLEVTQPKSPDLWTKNRANARDGTTLISVGKEDNKPLLQKEKALDFGGSHQIPK
jgi:hypothetical protein